MTECRCMIMIIDIYIYINLSRNQNKTLSKNPKKKKKESRQIYEKNLLFFSFFDKYLNYKYDSNNRIELNVKSINMVRCMNTQNIPEACISFMDA